MPELLEANMDLVTPKLERARWWGLAMAVGILVFLGFTNPKLSWFALVPALTAVFTPYYARKVQVPRYLNSRQQRAAYARRRAIIDEEGLEWELESGAKSKIEWSQIVKGKEILPGFVLYIAEAQFFLLPKRAFRSDADWERFKVLAEEKLAKRTP